MAIEVHDEPSAVDWTAGIECDRCLARFTFSGEDVWRTDNQQVARISCPVASCGVPFFISRDHVPSWVWTRFKMYETRSWD